MSDQPKRSPFPFTLASEEFTDEVVLIAMKRMDEVRAKYVPTEGAGIFFHGRTWGFSRENEKGFEKAEGIMELHQHKLALKIEDLKKNDNAILPRLLDDLTGSFDSSFQSMSERAVNEVVAGTDRDIQVGNGPISPAFLNAIESMQAIVGPDNVVHIPLPIMNEKARLKFTAEVPTWTEEFKSQVMARFQDMSKDAIEKEENRLSKFNIES